MIRPMQLLKVILLTETIFEQTGIAMIVSMILLLLLLRSIIWWYLKGKCLKDNSLTQNFSSPQINRVTLQLLLIVTEVKCGILSHRPQVWEVLCPWILTGNLQRIKNFKKNLTFIFSHCIFVLHGRVAQGTSNGRQSNSLKNYVSQVRILAFPTDYISCFFIFFS